MKASAGWISGRRVQASPSPHQPVAALAEDRAARRAAPAQMNAALRRGAFQPRTGGRRPAPGHAFSIGAPVAVEAEPADAAGPCRATSRPMGCRAESAHAPCQTNPPWR